MSVARHSRPKELEGKSLEYLDVFVEDESGKRLTRRLGKWECISCPPGVVHGYINDSLQPVYFQGLAWPR